MAKVKQSDRHSPEKEIKCKYARHFQTSKSEALAIEELNYIKNTKGPKEKPCSMKTTLKKITGLWW